MTARKLSDAEKRELVDRYRQPQETMGTLADFYGISASTVGRLLRQLMDASEYKSISQGKRAAVARLQQEDGGDRTAAPIPSTRKDAEANVPSRSQRSESPDDLAKASDRKTKDSGRRTRKRSSGRSRRSQLDLFSESSSLDSSLAEGDREPPVEPDLLERALSPTEEDPGDESEAGMALPNIPRFEKSNRSFSVEEELENDSDESLDLNDVDLDDLDEDDSDLDDLDEDDSDLDDLDEDDEFLGGDDSLDNNGRAYGSGALSGTIDIQPLSAAQLPAPCYLVIDRGSELVVQPLKAFGDLGSIPDEERDCKTLAVFDNHRVARRFSQRNHRIIKVPDGDILRKTESYLQDKNITRLLVRGQVYAL